MTEQYNQEVQVLRAVAVIFVLVHHLVGLFVWDVPRWEAFGRGMWVGVDLFFCVSGYVIARSLIGKLQEKTGLAFWRETGAFWLRRLYRITPSAWLWLFISMALGPLLHEAGGRGFSAPNLADAAAAILHVANFHFYDCTVGASNCGDLSIYWTLSLEEQFYILLPFTVLLFRKKLVPALILLILVQVFFHRPQWVGILSFVRTDAILFGVLIAIFSRTDVYKALDPQLNRSRFRFLIPPLLFFALLATTRYEIVSFSTGLAAVVCALIVWICSYERGYFFGPSPFRMVLVWIGTRSYAIYLIHIPVFWVTREIWARIEPQKTHFDSTYTLRFGATAIVLLLILSELNYRFIEEPLRKIGKKKALSITG